MQTLIRSVPWCLAKMHLESDKYTRILVTDLEYGLLEYLSMFCPESDSELTFSASVDLQTHRVYKWALVTSGVPVQEFITLAECQVRLTVDLKRICSKCRPHQFGRFPLNLDT